MEKDKSDENILNKNGILLKELICEIENILAQNKLEIANLADILKRIFFSGLICQINVSKVH